MGISIIETERLIIRRFTADDLEARHRMHHDAFHGNDSLEFKENDSLEASRQWLQWAVMNYRELEKLYQPPYGDYAVTLKVSGQLIGAVGLVPTVIPWGVFPAHRTPGEPYHALTSPEFGLFWAVAPAYWGNGYAPEAARAFIDTVFKQLKARRVVATTEFENHNSQRVMAKLGMRIEKNPGTEPFWFQVVGILDNPLSVRQP